MSGVADPDVAPVSSVVASGVTPVSVFGVAPVSGVADPYKIPRFQNGEMPKISENLATLFSNQLSHLNLILSLIINPCSITFKKMYPSLNLTLFSFHISDLGIV